VLTLCVLRDARARLSNLEWNLSCKCRCCACSNAACSICTRAALETCACCAGEFFEVYRGVVAASEFTGMVDELTSGPCIVLEIGHPCAPR
jgi:hypothetical protein